MYNTDYCNLFGIKISCLSIVEAVNRTLQGGLFLAPSGPGLAEIDRDQYYFQALKNADLNLPDSGLAILLMRLFGLGILPRTSGLGFTKALLNEQQTRRPGASYWILPSKSSLKKNITWLEFQGVQVPDDFSYIAPIYPRSGPINDKDLLSLIEKRRPAFIFVCVGSGPQEKIGLWLKQNLSYRPAIICIGAAIGFLSGDQVRIPAWADRICIGWLLRCLSNPLRFIPRYVKAFRLVYLILRYRDKAPPMKNA